MVFSLQIGGHVGSLTFILPFAYIDLRGLLESPVSLSQKRQPHSDINKIYSPQDMFLFPYLIHFVLSFGHAENTSVVLTAKRLPLKQRRKDLNTHSPLA